MAKFCPLFSSSSGNSVYIGSGESGILIDAGVSAKKIHMSLHSIGVNPETLNAIFITHEHSDHINGLRVFASKYRIKVYATEGTLNALEQSGSLRGDFNADVISPDGNDAGALFVKAFKTSHDAAESCGYTVDTPDGRKISVATDLGIMTDAVRNAVSGSDLILLESNHDVTMLENGPYPYPLKKRILGAKGHLSNDVCAEEAVKFIKSGTTRLVLGHLSKKNNFPELAYQTTYSALSEAGAAENTDYILKIAKPEWEGRAIIL